MTSSVKGTLISYYPPISSRAKVSQDIMYNACCQQLQSWCPSSMCPHTWEVRVTLTLSESFQYFFNSFPNELCCFGTITSTKGTSNLTYNPQSIGKVWSQKLKWSVVRLEVQTLSAQTLIIVIRFSYRKCLLHHVKLSKISTYISDMSRFRYIICFVLPPTISQDNLPILYSNKYKMRKKMIN